jgi:hypothetical protein
MSWFFVAAAVITVAAGAMEAKNQREAGKANAQIAENNARLDEAQAKDEAVLSARDQQQASWQTKAVIGKQKAALAANMIDSGEGTAFDLLGETAMMGGAEQSALAMEGARKAWGFQSQALNRRNEGAQAKWMGKAQGNVTLLRSIGQAAGYGSSAMTSYSMRKAS